MWKTLPQPLHFTRMAVWVKKTSWSTRSPLSFKRLFQTRTVSGYGYICCCGCNFACFYNLPIAFWKTRQTPLASTLLWCFYFAFWIIFKVLKMKINEIGKVHLYTVNQIAGITSSSSSSSSINLQTTSGVLSQMIIYTCPMETSFQQTMYKC